MRQPVRFTIILFALLLLQQIIPPSAYSEHRPVRVGLFPHFPLIHLHEGEPAGLYTDFLRYVAKQEHWELTFVEGSWSEGLKRLESGEIDLVTSIAFTEERARTFDYTRVGTVTVWGQLYVPGSSTISNILDLQGKRVAVLKNGVSGRYLMKLCREFQVDATFLELGSFDEVFAAILRGSAEAGVTNNIYGYTNERGVNLKRTPIIFNPFELYFATAKGSHPELLEAIDRHLKALKADKKSLWYEQLDYWFERNSNVPVEFPRWFWPLVWILLSLTLLGIFFSALLQRKVASATRDLSKANTDLNLALEAKEASHRLLVESRQRLALHVDNTPLAAIEWNLNNEVVRWNRSAERIFGYSAQEAIGRNANFIVAPSFKPEVGDTFRALHLRSGGGERINENITRDGRIIVCRWHNTPLVTDNGAVIGVASLADDITREVEHLKEMEHLNQVISTKNEDLEQIIYAASHDLRAPLVNIQGYSRELATDLDDLISSVTQLPLPEDVKQRVSELSGGDLLQSLEFIQSSVTRMDALLNSLLKLSRAGRAAIQIHAVAMQRLVREVTAEYDRQLAAAGGEIRCAHLPPCMGDEVQLQQVFSNLIGNALKYRHPARPLLIEIDATTSSGSVTYRIRDNGIGIPESHHQKVFEIFQRIAPDSIPGEGLGLTIVRRILSRLNGRIILESSTPDGSTFAVTLPASRETVTNATPPENRS